MTSIPSFKASLIQNAGVNKPVSAPSVEEILADNNQAQAALDSPPHSRKSMAPAIVTAAVALAALGFAGRGGMLGKRIQKILGGTPKLSADKVQERIQNKLNEYIGRSDANPFEITVLKNGKAKATRVKTNGNREIITFDKNTGLPEFRVEFANTKGGKALEYTSWKGADILDDGFDEANSFFKQYSKSNFKRKHLFGPKYTTSETVYGEMVKDAEKSTAKRTTFYYNDGSINKITEVDSASNDITVKDMLYGKDGQPKGIEVIRNDIPIIRKLKGENAITVDAPNRKSSFFSKLGDFFSIQKKNVIE